MSFGLMALALLTGVSLTAPGQTTAGEEKTLPVRYVSQERSKQLQMHEDIEIMRRLLIGKLQGFAPRTTSAILAHADPVWAHTALVSDCTGCHSNVHSNTYSNPYYDALRFNPNIFPPTDPNKLVSPTYQHRDALLLANNRFLSSARPAQVPDPEGTYLKGQGVIFTLTLPPPQRDPRPEAPKPAPKMPSEWERIRKEIRLEKPQAEEAAKPPREPSLSDVILKMLADNGRHFTQLGENETLTVAVTFRAPENGSVVAPGAAMLDFDNDGRMDLFIVNTVDQGTLRSPHLVQDDKPRNKPTTEDSTQKKVRDLVLLGELHLKQSKPDDAIKTLRQALELKPEGEQASTISRLLAQALVNTQKYDEAVQLLQKLADERKNKQTNAPPKTEASGAPQAAPLPSKLIISASKKLLDQVAAGQMSFEEFKKAASVEYLTFPTEKK